MKLKNKVLLSCMALAACATTMVSTTFAWYTTNTDVSATGAQGHTATTGTDTLLISPTGQAKSWTNTIKIDTKNPELKPLAYGKDGNGTNGLSNGDNAADEDFYNIQADGTLDTIAAKDGIIEFSVYLKNPEAASSQDIYLDTLTIVNAQSKNLPGKNVLTQTGLTGVNSPTYTVNILRATNVLLYSEVKTTGDLTAGEDKTFVKPTKKLLLDTTSFVADNDSLTGNNSGINAHEYYKAVTGKTAPFTGKNPLTDQKYVNSTSGSAFSIGQIKAGEIMKVTVKLFVNGADLECFDAIQGQTLTLGIGFSTSKTGAIKIHTSAN